MFFNITDQLRRHDAFWGSQKGVLETYETRLWVLRQIIIFFIDPRGSTKQTKRERLNTIHKHVLRETASLNNRKYNRTV